ncbi:MAG: hypothetical protein MI976_31740 [Pseudomonadales bacterium]|nr:hypothetical protein [Pseudomonadales bacterium]
MKTYSLKHYGLSIASVMVLAVMMHWSWKTLALLYAWPMNDFKHTVALLVLLAGVRIILFYRGSYLGRERETLDHSV